ncbi:MAG TPA: hypothetical protein VG992_04240 [Candidatus Saccharimonadales bacterium]|nr:hypothetical protein [Candidatus Saccharimonadales bacterium]
MRILAKTINTTRSGILAGSAAVLSLAAPVAMASAHGFNHSYSGDNQHRNVYTASHQQTSSTKRNMSDRPWRLSCTQEQAKLNSQAAAIKTADQKRLRSQNILYGGVTNYVSSNNVTVANYDTMKSKVDSDRTTATNDVNNLSAPQLNCTDHTRQASQANRMAVQAYERTEAQASRDLSSYRHDLAKLFYTVLNS